MACKFDSNKCSLTCKKYPMCSFYSVQDQLSNIQSQLKFIYTTIGEILKSNEENNIKIDLLEKGLLRISEIINDSETKLKL